MKEDEKILGNCIYTIWGNRIQIICEDCGLSTDFITQEKIDIDTVLRDLHPWGHENCPKLIKTYPSPDNLIK